MTRACWSTCVSRCPSAPCKGDQGTTRRRPVTVPRQTRPPEGLFAERLDRLFRTVHPKDRGPYTPAEAAEAINGAAGEKVCPGPTCGCCVPGSGTTRPLEGGRSPDGGEPERPADSVGEGIAVRVRIAGDSPAVPGFDEDDGVPGAEGGAGQAEDAGRRQARHPDRLPTCAGCGYRGRDCSTRTSWGCELAALRRAAGRMPAPGLSRVPGCAAAPR